MGSMLKPGVNGKSNRTKSEVKSIEERVLESTPLLEAFGNAKTLRNDNSSRFGKFIEIHFDEFGFIMGARIQTYLLEKSRIFKQVKAERNYHIFYQLLAGASEELKERFFLKEPSFYHYLSQSGCIEIEGVSDAETFQHTLTAMAVSGGIKEDEKQQVFCLLSIVLWLGNITFVQRRDDTVEVTSKEALHIAAELLQCNEVELEKVFTTRIMITGRDRFVRNMTLEQAKSARDSMSMQLYSQMFDWLVARINKSIQQVGRSKSFIGILDIYGFESFEKNSFEQFCINYANEKLQQLFNHHVFKEEQQEYMKEKIDWSYIEFTDNQDTLDLIESRPRCILALLDEQSTFPKATGLTFAEMLISTLGTHAKFEKPRFGKGTFGIRHYAGSVTYDTEAFLDKNKDFIIPEQLTLLQQCGNPFVKSLATANHPPQQEQQQYKFVSVGSQFSTSLTGLMKTISSTSPHYIRCIKPNPDKLPQVFVKNDIMHQLKCGGVMESVRICCAGYPTRRPMYKFYERYKILYRNATGAKIDQLVTSLLVGLEFPEDKYKIGRTKVFLRPGQVGILEDMRNRKLQESAITIQKNYRAYNARNKFVALRKAALCYQTYIRRCVSQIELRHLREKAAATCVQTFHRGYVCRTNFELMRKNAIILQRALRGASAKQELVNRKFSWSVSALQTAIRKAFVRKDYLRKIQGIRRLQAKWRGKLARRAYVQLRIEARSIKSLQDAKSKLEQKVEEVQWRLSAESRVRQGVEKELDEIKQKYAQDLEDAKKRFSISSDEYHTLTQQLEQLRRENETLKDAKSTLETKLSESSAQEDKSQKQIHTLLADLAKEREVSNERQFTVEELKYTIGRLEKEKESLKSTLENVREAEKNQKEQNEYLEATINGLQKDIQNWQERSKIDADKLLTMASEIRALKQTIGVKEEEGIVAKVQQQALEEKLSTHKEEAKKTISQLQTEKSHLEQLVDKYNMEKMREEIESNARTLVDAAKRDLLVSNLEKDIGSLKMQAEHTLQAHKTAEANWLRMETELKDNIHKLETELKQHHSTRSKFEDEYLGLKEKISTASQEAFYLKEANSQLQSNVQKLEGDLIEKRKAQEALAHEFESWKQNHSTLQLENQKLKDTITMLEQAKSSIDKKKSKLREFEESLTNKLEAKKAEVNELKANHAKDIEQLNRNLEEMKEKLNQEKTETFKNQFVKEQLESQINRLKEDYERAREENIKLKGKQKQAKEKISSKIEEESTAYKMQIELLKKEVEVQKDKAREEHQSYKTAQDKNVELGAEIARISQDNSRISQENARLSQENSRISEENANLAAQLGAVQNAHSDMHAEIIKMTSELEARQENLNRSMEMAHSTPSPSLDIKSDSPAQVSEADYARTFQEKIEEAARSAYAQSLQDEIEKYKALLQKADTEKLNLEASNRALTEEKVVFSIKAQRWESENAEMKRLYQPLKLRSEKLKMLEKIADMRESDWQRMARAIGYEPTPTQVIFREMLVTFGEDRTLAPVYLVYHQITYWRVIETEDLPVLQAVINSYTSLITKYANEMDTLTYIFSGISLLLYSLTKTMGGDMDELMTIEPLEVKQEEPPQNRRASMRVDPDSRKSGNFGGVLRSATSSGNIDPADNRKSGNWAGALRAAGSTGNIDITTPRNASPIPATPLSPAGTPPSPGTPLSSFLPSLSSSNALADTRTSSLRAFRPLKSSTDFFVQLKTLVAKCYGLLLSIVASRLDPLLETVVLIENLPYMAKGAKNEMPSLAPLITLLQKTLSIFQVNMVHLSLSQQFFSEVFLRINNFLMNGVLLRQQFCTEGFGVFLKHRIEHIHATADEMGSMWIGNIESCFQGIKQIAAVLALQNKTVLAEEKHRRVVCPNLNSLQLRQLLAMFTPGEFGKRVPVSIINAIAAKTVTTEHDRILIDINVVRAFPMRVLHYFEVEDMQRLAVPPTTRAIVDGYIK